MQLSIPSCAEQSPEGYLCTRPQGHTGQHAAHGLTDIAIAQWGPIIPLGFEAAGDSEPLLPHERGLTGERL